MISQAQLALAQVITMPILPLDAAEPFAATLGIMLYPGYHEMAKAQSFGANYLVGPLRDFHAAGHRLPYDKLLSIACANTEFLTDVPQRNRDALAFGDVVSVFFTLSRSHPELASWNNAIQIVEAPLPAGEGSRTTLLNAKNRFAPVAHLWGAWSMRGGRFGENLGVGYTGRDDFESFLAESEILRDWGMNWRPARNKSNPPFPSEVWSVPPTWVPPERQPGWPATGQIRLLEIPKETLRGLRPAGRPKGKST